jgi:hypothetical protein
MSNWIAKHGRAAVLAVALAAGAGCHSSDPPAGRPFCENERHRTVWERINGQDMRAESGRSHPAPPFPVSNAYLAPQRSEKELKRDLAREINHDFGRYRR